MFFLRTLLLILLSKYTDKQCLTTRNLYHDINNLRI